MRPVRILAVFVLLFMAVLASAADTYTSKTGAYEVTFPAKPTESSTPDADVNPEMGKYKYYSVSYEKDKETAYMVMYHDYPPGVLKAAPQLVLERVKDGCKGENGRVVEDKEISIGAQKLPGREFTLQKSDFYHRARIYLKDNRLYQVIIIGKTKDAVMAPEATKVLDSFKITS